jgi:hypothetical protein
MKITKFYFYFKFASRNPKTNEKNRKELNERNSIKHTPQTEETLCFFKKFTFMHFAFYLLFNFYFKNLTDENEACLSLVNTEKILNCENKLKVWRGENALFFLVWVGF